MASTKALDDPESYTVGWIAALPIERAAAVAMLDEKHTEPKGFARHPTDTNVYTWGRMGDHNIVIASLAAGIYGLTSAATTASSLSSSLPSIRIGLLVGIGGGIPRPDEGRDIRLGDVVVSQPDGTTGGVCQYDLVKAKPGDRRERKGFLGMPPAVLLKALASIQAEHEIEDSIMPDLLQNMLDNNPKMAKITKQSPGYVHQGFENDRLFDASYDHVHGPDCRGCEAGKEVERDPRDTPDPEIHYGIIASGNTLVKDAAARQQIVADVGEDCICFEMEAAGLMNHFPCLVIRGICDYADSHKNDRWQRYASATAAAFAKEFLAYVPASEVRESKRALEILESIEPEIDDIHRNTEDLVSDAQKEEIRKWLSPPDPSTNANQARKLRHDGTGAWLFETDAFQKWAAGTYRHLWVHGLAGSGKTVLSSTILDHLAEQNHRVILSFFFDFSEAAKQTDEGMLRSLVWQLYCGGFDSTKQLDKILQTHGNGVSRPTTKTLKDAFCAMLAAQKDVFIVLDALDESTTRNEVCSWIQDLFSAPELVHVQMIYTSRPEAEFLTRLPLLIGDQCSLPLDKVAVDLDICSYVEARLDNDPDFIDMELPEDLRQMVRDKVGKGAAGMFRWAFCQLDSLSKCMHSIALEEDVKQLPKDLTETYERMLDSIPQKLRRSSVRLLQFVVHAKDPLTVPEAIDILATDIEEGPPHFNPKARLFRQINVLRHCPGLVSVIEVNSREGPRKELHLAHFSVKEYLLGRCEFDLATASITITRVYLAYLTDIKGSRWQLRKEYPLAESAARLWLEFAKKACEEPSQIVATTIFAFMQDSTASQRWDYFYEVPDDWGIIRHGPRGSNLYRACLGGLTPVAKLMIDQGANVNSRHGYNEMALTAASSGGHLETVRLLLDNQVDINEQGGKALEYASTNGHLDVVRLLLDRQASLHARDCHRATAIKAASSSGQLAVVQMLLEEQAGVQLPSSVLGAALAEASRNGHLAVVQMLLEEQAGVQLPSSVLGAALAEASQNGYLDVVQLLLDNHADVNASDSLYGGAIRGASFGGHLEIVQALLDSGADVNQQGGHYGNALEAARAGGQAQIVHLLLSHGADVTLQGGIYGSLLNTAALRNDEEMVERLLKDGVDVNAQFGDRRTSALHLASERGHETIVEILINYGANVNTLDHASHSPLHQACRRGHETVVGVLLEAGAIVNYSGIKHKSDLLAACKGGNSNIVETLIDHGAQIDGILRSMVDEGPWTALHPIHGKFWQILADIGVDFDAEMGGLVAPLHYACLFGEMDPVEVLVGLGADVNAPSFIYNSALSAAVEGDEEETVLWLLERGAEITKKDGTPSDTIQKASKAGRGAILEMLLDWGADVDAKDSNGFTALHHASSEGYFEVVELLLKRGADVTAVEKRGWTPLHAASYHGHLEVVSLLLGMPNLSAHVEELRYGRNALSLAAEYGHEEIVKLLLSVSDTSPQSRDHIGRTPLFFASKEGHEAIVNILLQRDQSANQADYYDSTPLSVAARRGHVGVVKTLLETENPGVYPDSFNQTPLWWARRQGHDNVVELLLEAGKQTDTDISSQITPDLSAKVHDPQARYCDICTFSISGESCYYRCPVCNLGDFDVCEGCFEIGGRCLVSSHELLSVEPMHIQHGGGSDVSWDDESGEEGNTKEV